MLFGADVASWNAPGVSPRAAIAPPTGGTPKIGGS